MEKQPKLPERQPQTKEGYYEPLLIKHEPLRNITGAKYGEKVGGEMES